MSLVFDGRKVETPGLNTVSFLDDRSVPRTTDTNPRVLPIEGIVCHTVKGSRGPLKPGGKPSDRDLRYAKYQHDSDRKVSWDATTDTDASISVSNDPVRTYCWQAGSPSVNSRTLGTEAVQESDGTQYEDEIDAEVKLIELYCAHLYIPRRTPVDANGQPYAGLLDERVFKGVYGHRNIWGVNDKGARTTMRGYGDPGDWIFKALIAAGFQLVPVDVHGRIEGVLEPPPPPTWMDRSQEITDTSDRPVDRLRFATENVALLRGMGLNDERSIELTAHSATETGWGKRAIGENGGGVKMREDDDRAYRAKHGHGLPWWRAQGHVQAGDAAWVYYRSFEDRAEFWRFFLKRYVPQGASPTERYAATGAAFWGDSPAQWFVELLRAGYRGSVRRAQVEGMILRHEDIETHDSIRAHRKVVDEVRSLLSAR